MTHRITIAHVLENARFAKTTAHRAPLNSAAAMSTTSTGSLALVSAVDLAAELGVGAGGQGHDGCGAVPLVLEASSAVKHPHPPPPGSGADSGAGAVPGAVLFRLALIDVYDEDADSVPRAVPGNYNLRAPEEVRAALEAAGVARDRRVVVYTQSRKAGGLDVAVACRLAWALCTAGVNDVGTFVTVVNLNVEPLRQPRWQR